MKTKKLVSIFFLIIWCSGFLLLFFVRPSPLQSPSQSSLSGLKSNIVRVFKVSDQKYYKEWGENIGTISSQTVLLGEGHGFFIQDSLVVTNAHVVDPLTGAYVVQLWDGKYFPVKNIWKDSHRDLAILRLAGLTTLPEWGIKLAEHMPNFSIGMPVYSLRCWDSGCILLSGSLLGSQVSLVLSDSNTLSWLLHYTMQIEAGDSWSPLFDSAGHLLGITTAMRNDTAYALPLFLDEVTTLLLQISQK